MKRRLVGAAVAVLLAVSGCAYSPADSYSDFLSDSDLLMRFGVCFEDIANHRDTFYTQGELRTLVRDLEEGYAVDSEAAQEATRLYQESARLLLRFLTAGNRPESSYLEAKACFAAAQQRTDQIRGGGEAG